MSKWSDFNYCFNNNDEVVLFNTLNTGIVVLEQEVYNEISCFLDNDTIDCKNIDVFNQLNEMGFIVDSKIDEFSNFYHSITKYIENDKSLHVFL
ncbi:MAG: hypothetical protein M0Q94_05730 [Candidatus Cloacimonetes bacterium]|nr:hypothetical protein [Candidatus Cloacimonadota bacterium]